MHGDGAEVTFAVAPAVGGHGKAHGFEQFDGTLFFIIRMLVAFKRQAVSMVEFFLGQVVRGGILHPVARVHELAQPFRIQRVIVLVEMVEHSDESFFVFHHSCMRRQFTVAFGFLFADIAQPADCRGIVLRHAGLRPVPRWRVPPYRTADNRLWHQTARNGAVCPTTSHNG